MKKKEEERRRKSDPRQNDRPKLVHLEQHERRPKNNQVRVLRDDPIHVVVHRKVGKLRVSLIGGNNVVYQGV